MLFDACARARRAHAGPQYGNTYTQKHIYIIDDANYAQDVAQQELAKQRTQYSEARAQRESALRERQRVIQLQLRKRRQERDQLQSKARQSMDGSKSQGQKDEDDDEDEENSEVRLAALKTELEGLRQCSRRVKDMIGIAEAEDMLPKLAQQTENMQHLLSVSKENQVGLTVTFTCLFLSFWLYFCCSIGQSNHSAGGGCWM